MVLTHANIIAGLNAITSPAAVGPADRWGLWLPLFHDMGIFSLLAAMSVGADVVLWQPRAFVRKPLDWIAEFAEAGCTLCSAPNFFFDTLVAASRARQDEPSAEESGPSAEGSGPVAPDLSRWRLTFNGAEPVNATTVDEFCAEFAPNGFRRAAMYPVYGMAEATLAVTFPRWGASPSSCAWTAANSSKTAARSRRTRRRPSTPPATWSAWGSRSPACGCASPVTTGPRPRPWSVRSRSAARP